MFAQKGKYSLWESAGIASNLPKFVRYGFVDHVVGRRMSFPLGFTANLELSNRWRFNESHSIHLNAGVQRFQFYQPRKYKDIFQENGFDPLTKYLELKYRFEPKHSRLFFETAYKHSFNNNEHWGNFNFGLGFKF